ncbi:hypothetical protein [Streptomyces sp. NBC_01565]|uniref:hypothetical protein n=1 Tax=unclassified Streptomyces TaxID=2593676 RepID=UPI00225746C7|nr:hypothetical protein [Streptomyces sp. NBC_01565]MCX4546722.1 hypothetical protein [Streptomyces sp. NBC_01565]
MDQNLVWTDWAEAKNLEWTEWAEAVSEDGNVVVRARLGMRVATTGWGRKSLSIWMKRIAYLQQDGVRRPIKPLIENSRAGGGREKMEVVRTTGEACEKFVFKSPGAGNYDSVRFFENVELDDGEYIVRTAHGALTSWWDVKDSRTTVAPLPYLESVAFLIEGSAPAAARPPIPMIHYTATDHDDPDRCYW